MVNPLILFAILTLSACTAYTEKKVESPKPISQETPVYPHYVHKNRMLGLVKFNYDVDKEGNVSQIRITESNPDHHFDDVAIKAVSKWRFEKNKPVNNMPATMKFYMNSPKSN
ncbi:TonB family protein [Rahnella inusitata]|uniref:TonB family protein n=1 Tax=Rahnella inusitata TaxID=58169 RepID=UPI0039BDF213